MMKLIYILTHWRSAPRAATAADTAARGCDPLSHPAIRGMSPDELADLPFGTARNRKS